MNYNKVMTGEVKFAAIQFAQACIDMNTVGELRYGLEFPDVTSMKDWGLTKFEYEWALGAAIYALETGGSIMDDGRVVI